MTYRILIVDDEVDIVKVLASRLAREGYEVSVAHDGQEALDKVRDDNPDLLLLDLMLPVRNGFEVLKHVRETYTDKWRPVIIVSGKGELESVKECYNMEADSYLSKPCTIETILRGIETMISLIPQRIHKP